MRRSGLFGTTLAVMFSAIFLAPAFAAGVEGVWMRSDGEAKVRFSPCGGGMCGSIVWLKRPNGPAHVGEQVFFGMGQTGPNTYSGQAHNPEDGKDYDGTMTVSGSRMSTQGCALGGAICKTSSWIRSR